MSEEHERSPEEDEYEGYADIEWSIPKERGTRPAWIKTKYHDVTLQLVFPETPEGVRDATNLFPTIVQVMTRMIRERQVRDEVAGMDDELDTLLGRECDQDDSEQEEADDE